MISCGYISIHGGYVQSCQDTLDISGTPIDFMTFMIFNSVPEISWAALTGLICQQFTYILQGNFIATGAMGW